MRLEVIQGGRLPEQVEPSEVDEEQPVRHYVAPGQLTGDRDTSAGVEALCGILFHPPRPVDGQPAVKAPICGACAAVADGRRFS